MPIHDAGQAPSFPGLDLRRLARAGSTQDVVRRAARAAALEGFCCVAAEQTAGRGRQGRSWVAPPGTALLVSLLLRRRAAVTPGIPLAAGLAVVDALAGWGVRAALKWPNDVMAGRSKLAGILVEVEPAASTPELLAVAVGLGLNLHVSRFPEGVAGTSLHELCADPPAADGMLTAWLRALDPRLQQLERGGVPAIVREWRKHATGLGLPVTVRAPGGTITGIAQGVDDDGALLVANGGITHRVLAGDVHIGTHPST